MTDKIYFYNAKIISVYDGDTVRADIDFGFNIGQKNMSLRLFGIDTPEIRGESKEIGIVARDRLRELILDRDVLIESIKDKSGKYGRYLAKIWLDGVLINDLLIKEGFAKEYK